MMNIPSLPTDNLYKFLALSGIAIAILSLVFPMTRISEIRLKLIEVETQYKVLNFEIDELTKDVDTWEKKTSYSTEDTTNIRKRSIEIKLKQIELKGRTKQIEALMEDLKSSWRLLKVGGPLGLVLSFLSFVLWYFLVQKPNDLLLLKKVKSKET